MTTAEAEFYDETEETESPPLIMSWLNASCQHIALLTAWIATCGSLYFSEVLRWAPCEMCWFQRVLMYPIALLLTVGIIRNDRSVHAYVLPLSLLGLGTSLYHYLLVKTSIFPPPPCSGGVSCTVDYIDIFGFINIPFMALVAFTIISIMMGHSMLNQAEIEEEPTDQAASGFAASAPATRAQLAVPSIITLVLVIFVGLGAVYG